VKEGSKRSPFFECTEKESEILFSEIVYIESQREYIRIVTTKKMDIKNEYA
jgi:hypothetical protein